MDGSHLSASGGDRGRPHRLRHTLFALLLCASGCGTVQFEAPPGREVRLLEQDEPVTVSVSQKIWYAGWGTEPLCNNSTAPLIEEHNLREVRLSTNQTFFDNVFSTIAGAFSFSVRTMYVEGRP